MFVLAATAATVPTKPTVTVGTPTATSLTFTLTVPSIEPVFGVDGYDIEQSLDGGLTWAVVVRVVDLPYILRGLTIGTTYFLRARAVSLSPAAYRSAASAVVIASTTGGPPVWNGTPQTLAFTAGKATPGLLLTAYVTDPQGQALTISTASPLPPGMSLVANSLIGTPTLAGSYPVVWKATDSGGRSANSPNWTVSVSPAAAQAPVWNPNPQSFTFQTGAAITPLDLSPYASDPGGLAITITLLSGSLPPGLTLVGNKIIGVPTTAGTYTPAFKATNTAGLSANSPAWTVTTQSVLPTARRIYADWGIAVSPSQANTRPQDAPSSFIGIPNGGKVTGVYPANVATGAKVSDAGPVCSGVTYLEARLNWGGTNGIDNGGGTYDWTYPDAMLAQARALNVGIYFTILTRTFNITAGGADQNPAPADLKAFSETYSAKNPGYQVWRWSPKVLARFLTFMVAFGARYNLDPFFAGVGTQETSTGGASGNLPNTGNYTVSLGALGNYVGTDTYTAAGFVTALEMEKRIVGITCPNARGLHYNNFIQGDTKTVDLLNDMLAIATVSQQYGGMWGFPDLVTDLEPGSINAKVYPTVAKYTAGSSGIAHQGLTFGAIQPDEWNAAGAAQQPRVAFPPGPLNPSLQDLLNWAQQSNTYPTSLATGARDHRPSSSSPSPINLDSILADYRPASQFSTSPNWNDLVPIIKANPVLRNVTPNP